MIDFLGQYIARFLANHHDRHDDDGGDPFDINHATMLAVADGKITKSAAADHACHR